MRISLYYLIIPALILGSCASNNNAGNNNTGDSTTVDSNNVSKMQDTATNTSTADPAGNIAMTLSPGTYKSSTVGKATLTITNNSTEDVSFGDPYKVEYNNGGNWEKVSIFDEVVFTAMMHAVAPGKSQEFPINLQPVPYDYKPGEYRILKGAQSGDKSFQLTTTFTVDK
ncbi:immunoglobulin-like domain-containing protein [Chitinophaga rhizophila]|uniref:Bacterial Ig-like domain-containing protein n=1 Tax=Chitinophaga rhizophila TaxID=2866212 RepID=A0ABS7G9Y9_9BACT|nr:immunoglobulin-like domain-containing protein [Chitinophaga rhizophila]MBW8684476.1 hypothetical protein [Chitinophaga rhizophila]